MLDGPKYKNWRLLETPVLRTKFWMQFICFPEMRQRRAGEIAERNCPTTTRTRGNNSSDVSELR